MRACGPWECGPETYAFPDAEGPVFPEGNNQPRREFLGEEGMVSGGVFDHGTHEEDGPVTWEALASPRHTPVMRGAGDPSPTHGTLRAHVSSAQEA
jgi:hypothetical protein